MIVVAKKDADPALRLIVFVRPALLWVSLFLVLMSTQSGSVGIGMIDLCGSVIALMFYRITCNDWGSGQE